MSRFASALSRVGHGDGPSPVRPVVTSPPEDQAGLLDGFPDGTERVADEASVPPFGHTWPSRWNDGRCVRCDGRRWVWAESEGRWLCAACGASDPHRPMPTRPVVAPEPAGHAPQATVTGWPPECLASERLYGVRSSRLYRLLGKGVTTPAGTGVLLQVFSSRVAVLVDGAVLHFRPAEVRP